MPKMFNGANYYKLHRRNIYPSRKSLIHERNLPAGLWPLDLVVAKVFGHKNLNLPHREIKDNAHFYGVTEIWTGYNPLTKTATIQSLAIDTSFQKQSESVKQAAKLLSHIEKEAKRAGARRILTSPTLINPRVAKRLGYELVKTIVKTRKNGEEEKFYTYKKLLN